jgi:hypothetical protein
MIRVPVAIAAALLFVACSLVPAFAQKGTTIQPDHLPFGTVYTGAIVEGSFLVITPGKDTKVPFTVTAPKFITVRGKDTYTRQSDDAKDFLYGSFEFVVDTAAARNLSGEIRVTLGSVTVTASVSATVKPAKKGMTRVLVVETPFEAYSTGEGTHFKAWTDLVNDAALDVNYLLVASDKPVLRDLDLSRFDSVLLAGGALVWLQAVDARRVRAFAEAGGRVVLSANYFFRGTVEKANTILTGSGLQMRDVQAEGISTPVTLTEKDFDATLVKAGLKSARFFLASPVSVTNKRTGQVLVKAVGVGMPGDGFVARAKVGKGEIIALGESLWWNWITEKKAAGSDNVRLLRWMLEPRRK